MLSMHFVELNILMRSILGNSAADVDMLLDRDNKLAIGLDLQLEARNSLRERRGSSSADSTKNRQGIAERMDGALLRGKLSATQEEEELRDGGSTTGSVVSDLLQDEAYLEGHDESSDVDASTTLLAPDTRLRRRHRKHSPQVILYATLFYGHSFSRLSSHLTILDS